MSWSEPLTVAEPGAAAGRHVTHPPAPSVAHDPLVEVQDLFVRFPHASNLHGRGAAAVDLPVIKGISFTLRRGECLALVGESGSGKSVTARTLVGLAGAPASTGYGAEIRAKRLRLAGEDLLSFRERDWLRVRGSRVGFVMQDALGSLDNLRTVGREVGEALELHGSLTRAARELRVIELLRATGVPLPEVRALQYPHQLSGGLRQRALIASAIACGPELLIADEPTTALDASVQAQVLDLLESLRTPGNGMLVISHDIGVVARLADRVVVMRYGEIVEQGSAEQVLHDPQHAYTKSLLAAVAAVHVAGASLGELDGGAKTAAVNNGANSSKSGGSRSLGASPRDFTAERVLLKAGGLSKSFLGPDGTSRPAVAGVTLQLRAGQTLGIVGESGSGKTTLIRMILGLEAPDSGFVQLRDKLWSTLSPAQQRAERRRMQVIFQDPLASFDPRYTVERVLGEALEVAGLTTAVARRRRAVELLHLVRLDDSYLTRRPVELSGGQRQRVAIARALAPEPEILVCDEPVSALDVSVQAQILQLLADLKSRLGLSCLFISHDLGVIHHVSDHVLVMKDGRVVESGPVGEVFHHAQHPYTRELLNAIPRLHARRAGAGARSGKLPELQEVR
ncbi:ABC transporter ATP-binding protein [Verrucomicrobia bacterium LW23]|nr:ABC transporter ATP-binding protein [Verrucomicrobia bacterium LW23]